MEHLTSQTDHAEQLRVAEAYHKDAGKGVARIGSGAWPVWDLKMEA